MGKVKKTKKFGAVKRMIHEKDPRLNKGAVTELKKKPEKEVRHVEKPSSALFFKYNTQLGPPYHVLVDTNFINFSIRWAASPISICPHGSPPNIAPFSFDIIVVPHFDFSKHTANLLP